MLCGERLALGLVFASAATILPTAAPAQAAPAQVEPVGGHTFKQPERTITLSIASELLYDTNVAKGSDAVADLRDVEKHDVRTSNAAAVELVLPVGRATASLEGTIGHDAYARNDRLSRERIDIRGGAVVPLAFCTVDAQVGYGRWQNDLVDLAIDPAAPARSSVNVQTVMQGQATLSCGPAIGIRPYATAAYQGTKNSAAVRRMQNVEQIDLTAGLSYANPAVGIVSIFARRSDFDYQARRVGGAVLPIGFSIAYGGARFDRRLGARLQLIGSLSYADVSVPAILRSSRDLDGLTWDLAATLRAGDRALLSISTARTIEASSGFFANFIRKSSVAGTLAYAPAPALVADVTASHWHRTFQVGDVRQDLLITQDVNEEYAVGLEYKRRRVRLRVNGSYRRRDADPDIYDFDGFLVSFAATYRIGG
jgi:hypothetical protein